jgi:hypothetical protein
MGSGIVNMVGNLILDSPMSALSPPRVAAQVKSNSPLKFELAKVISFMGRLPPSCWPLIWPCLLIQDGPFSSTSIRRRQLDRPTVNQRSLDFERQLLGYMVVLWLPSLFIHD